MTQTLDISVIICTYTEARWDDLIEAVESIRRQTRPPLETIVVVDHNPVLFERVRICLPDAVPVENKGSQGVSGARNSGVAVAKTALVAFLDDDAVALPNWLEQLCAGYGDLNTLGVGGSIQPLWQTKQPTWFPEEFNWVIGSTYKGRPETTAPVRNVWSGNMSVRRQVFESIGGFRNGFGKVGTLSCPEDTDLCIRALQRWPQGVWLHKPDARVLHKVPADRASWRYYSWRCYNEGLGKARLSRLVGTEDGLTDERRHALYTLPQGAARGVADMLFRHDPAGARRAGAILAGLALATAGYLVGWVQSLCMPITAKLNLEDAPVRHSTLPKKI